MTVKEATTTQTYFGFEVRFAFKTYYVFMLLIMLIVGILTSIFIPRMPQVVYHFFEKVYHLKNWTDMIILGDFAGLFVIPFWLGAFSLLQVYVVPREEQYLDLYLSKPLTRTQYLQAKVLPTFGIIAVFGIFLALSTWIKIAVINGTGDLHSVSFFASSLLIICATLAFLALINFVFLFFKETYNAVVIAFLIFMVSILPSSIYMYRPDVINKSQLIRDIVVFPANLLWYKNQIPTLTLYLVPFLICITALLIWIAGIRLERSDVV